MLRVRLGFYIVAALLAVTMAYCAGGLARRREPVTIKGSDTMVILGQRWAERYMKRNQGAVVQVTGGGSGTGIAALINGTTDICESSRPMKEREREEFMDRYDTYPYEILVARDALTIYVHDSNPVRSLTLADLKAIYTGVVTNWRELGGADAPIVLYGRENSSGTYDYVRHNLLEDADYSPAIRNLPGTAAVVSAVANDPRGIGYGGAAYTKGVRSVALRREPGAQPVPPTADNVEHQLYPITRGLYFYMPKPPTGPAKDFVNFVLSDSGQAIVAQVGYFPIR